LLKYRSAPIKVSKAGQKLEEACHDSRELAIELRILKAIRRIIRSVDIYSRRLNREHNLTTPQLICLTTLSETAPTMISWLSKQVNLSASTVNGIVDRLEAKGLVERHRSGSDRRRVYVDITPPGRELIAAAPPLLQEHLVDALKRLPKLEQGAIALSLERVVQLMGVEDIDASPNLMPDGRVIGSDEEGA